jgi:TetR/AcrR family transcriptional repressor of bet genes
MPRISVEPKRRSDLLAATITEIGRAGSLDVTMGQIAARAGVSSALAHHYFGSKDRMLLAAMRSVLTAYGQDVRDALRGRTDPRDRLDAIVAASFSARNFGGPTIAAWLNFYVLARTSDQARRLLNVYHRRLRSNLVSMLRPALDVEAPDAAEQVAALIDGLYLRQALSATDTDTDTDGAAANAIVGAFIDTLLSKGKAP